MGNLKASIDALQTVSMIFGMVPLVGENLKSAAELASKICEQVQTMKESHEGYEQLSVQVTGLLVAVASVLEQSQQDKELESVMKSNVEGLINVLKEIEAAVRMRLSSHPQPVRKRERVMAWWQKEATNIKMLARDPDELENLRRKVQNVMDGFTVSYLLRNELNSLRTRNDINDVNVLARQILEEAERAKRDADIALLESLGPVASAAWDADVFTLQKAGNDVDASTSEASVSMCTPGTREPVLNDILAWASAVDSPCVFWLNGLAGTGKSTIARTLCERLQNNGLLGASFFISRDHPDRRKASNIVRSIAYQFAARCSLVSNALCAKLRETPISTARSLESQIRDFIIAPTRELQGDTSLVIVVDALDECLSDFQGRPGGELLLLLVRQLGGRLKLFITSRNEVSIQHMFSELSAAGQTVLKLHDLDESVVRDDITTYLVHSFAGIRNSRRELALINWPPVEDINKLVELSGLLFIYAATAVRFVNNNRFSPRKRLAQLLAQERTTTRTSPYGQLDRFYRQILSDGVRASDAHDEAALCQRLHAFLVVVVLAQTPLSVEALAVLSGTDQDDTNIVLGDLSSLLADSTSGVRVFHPSFFDFAVDSARCTDERLCVAPVVDHTTVALRCLSLLNKNLRYNICNIQNPNVANTDVKGLDLLLRENLSDASRYAVCFWCIHISASGAPDDACLDALKEFCRKHLLHWLEGLSLMEYVPPAEAALIKVIEWCGKHPSDTTALAAKLLQDFGRALQVFATPVRSHALHAYHSAFVMMPKCLLLETLAQEHPPSGLARLVSRRAAHWGPSPRVLEGHSNGVACVSYSRDGTRIVSGSEDKTVRVWNAVTFQPLAELKGHQGWVCCVAFSPDGKQIISGSDDFSIRVWNATTFEQLVKLEGHQGSVTSVAFSSDGQYIVSGSGDHTLRIWNVITFEHLAELKGHRDRIWSIGISPNGTRIASGSGDCTVRIWDAVTFEKLAHLNGHRHGVTSISYSPNGLRIVSGSEDCTLRVWDANTFEQLAELSGHQLCVRSTAFSPDGTRIVSGSQDYTMRVWDGETFEHLAELEGHQDWVRSSEFSPDGTYIVSGSSDRTVRVWNAVTYEEKAGLEGHSYRVWSVAFSPTGTRIVSSSGHHTVVWNAITFEQLAELKGHKGAVNSIVFSLDGAHIVSASDDGTVRVWDATTFEQLAKLEGHESRVWSVDFSPNRPHVVSGSGDRTVRIWDVIRFKELATLEGHHCGVNSVAFSPDGAHIVSGSNDCTVRVWSAVTFQQLAELKGHETLITAVAFSQDTKTIRSRDWVGKELDWTYSDTVWTKISPAQLSSSIARTTRRSDTELMLSNSGWLSCSYGAQHIMIWLPLERRGRALAGCRGRMVVGAEAGAITILELPARRG